MLQTTRGDILTGAEEAAYTQGIDFRKPLSEKQIEHVKRMGLDVDSATIFYNSRELDSYRISKAELDARRDGGEEVKIPLGHEEVQLNEAQKYQAAKLGVDPKRAAQVMTDSAGFIPKAEREAKKNG